MSVLLAALASATPAFAEVGVPHWKLESRSAPSNLPLEHKGTPGEGIILVTLANLSAAEVNGEAQQVKVTDKLPEGLEITSIAAQSRGNPQSQAKNIENPNGFKCSETEPRTIKCTYGDKLSAYEQLEIEVKVKVKTEVPSEPVNEVTVTGGETKSASLQQPLRVNGQPTPFGVEQYELTPENEDGSTATQAGSHPFQMTTTFNLNQVLGPDYNQTTGEPTLVPSAPALQRNLHFKLPPGLLGNPNAVKQCRGSDFGALGTNSVNSCPADTVVGVATVTFNEPVILHYYTATVPVFNLVPANGEPAQFGFEAAHVPIILNTSVRTGGDYGVTVSVYDAPQSIQVLGSRVTIWGVPYEPSHDQARGWGCLLYSATCEKVVAPQPEPFLTLPTACLSRPTTGISGESWLQGNGTVAKIEEGEANTGYRFPSTLTGCELLDFSPTISVEPEAHAASTPTGLTIRVHTPQTSTLEAKGLAESAVKETKVELPEGVMVNPSASNGLQACGEAETELSGGVGFTGFAELDKEGEPGSHTATFTEKLPQPLEPGRNFCPNASKIGIVHIKTPDLARRRLPNGELSNPELEGGVYIARQNANPFGSLFAMYIVAEEPESGVLVKLAGEVSVNEQTGRLTTTFKSTPNVPFEDLRLELFGGPRASLSTPPSCGAYKTETSFTPWSGTEVKKPSSSFNITSGPNGAPCSSPLPFAPGFQAGSTNAQGGAFTPFTLTINRADGEQALKSITMQLPPGLAAMLASVTPCPEPQAANDECGPESLIGHSTASAGVGSEPVTLGGNVYLTGPYKGAPFGILAVTRAKAGPFDLGDVPVRSTINVDPNTAAASITSDPLPRFVKGVPSQIKQLNVTIDHAGFQFNPTNCSPMAITGTLTGYEGFSEAVSSPFQAANCASLPFKPNLTVSVGKTFSKQNGVSFIVRVSSTHGEANLAKTRLVIPKTLPSRLTTIQKACPDSLFNSTPTPGTACGEGSNIGSAIVHTPVLKNPLKGPAYLVSHGGAAFPDVEFVLQGEGILLVLDGQTDIKNGVTTSTFNSVPDAPVQTFEAILPAGPHSALTVYAPGKTNLCGAGLVAPTTITGQNGKVIEQNTPVAVEGCSGVASFRETNAQRLAKALKACRKKKNKGKRVACERKARKLYASKAPKPKKKK